MRTTIRASALLAAAGLLLSACGSDDASEVTPLTDPPVEGSSEPESDPTTEELSAMGQVCELTAEMVAQESPLPSAEQLTRYVDLAPAEIADDVSQAAEALIPLTDDPVAFLAKLAEDETEHRMDRMQAWENENCGLEHRIDPTPGSSWELDEAATRVDIVASEFAFEVATELDAGPTSFVVAVSGEQAHHMVVLSIPEGATADEAIQSEGQAEEVGVTHLVAPDGVDEEFLTVDLAPGTYGFYCFLPSDDGTPHVLLGMTETVTVT